jgi:DNA-binding NtrC family response regulator
VQGSTPQIVVASEPGLCSPPGGAGLLCCSPEQIPEALRDSRAQGVLLVAGQFDDTLPGQVRSWLTWQPELQVLLVFRQAPPTRGLTELMRAGAYDVVEAAPERPLDSEVAALLETLRRRVEELRAGRSDRAEARATLAEVGLVGESPAMQDLFVQVRHAARLQCAVHIFGEGGTGKALVAHALHLLSKQREGLILTVDCASLSPQVLRTLLGGPGNSRGPLLRQAHRGTLYLRHVSETPYAVQQEFVRLLDQPAGPEGGLEVRFLSSANRRIDELTQWKRFREDLCYRLNVLTIEIPPLRRRTEDIPTLARLFLTRQNTSLRQMAISPEAMRALTEYHWPGNVRQLRDAVEHAVLHCPDELILPEHLPAWIQGRDAAPPAPVTFVTSELNLAALERQAILRALQVTGFDKSKSARLLGIGKTTMYRKLKALGRRGVPHGRRPEGA